jgi:hypothetical protein
LADDDDDDEDDDDAKGCRKGENKLAEFNFEDDDIKVDEGF